MAPLSKLLPNARRSYKQLVAGIVLTCTTEMTAIYQHFKKKIEAGLSKMQPTDPYYPGPLCYPWISKLTHRLGRPNSPMHHTWHPLQLASRSSRAVAACNKVLEQVEPEPCHVKHTHQDTSWIRNVGLVCGFDPTYWLAPCNWSY